MALFHRLYFNAVFGGLGGLLGWMLFGVLGERTAGESDQTLNLLLGGVLIGALIGYFIVGVDALRDQAPVKFARLGSYGAVLGGIGGAAGMYLGDLVNYGLIYLFSDSNNSAYRLVISMLARGLGWSFLGVAIGASEGIAARSLGKLYYGTVGGLCGGFVGGVLFELFYALARQTLSTTYFWSALGLVILGACIGMLSALVQAVFQPASVRVLRGWQEGREYALDKSVSLLGRDEHVDIALFRDMKVEKQHAVIEQKNGAYVLVNHGSPPEFTLVNDVPVIDRLPLHDGDRIQLGNVILRFQLRAAVIRAKRRPAGVADARSA